MKLKLFPCMVFMTMAFLLQMKEVAGQETLLPKEECQSYIEIQGSSNVNQFELVNYNPNIVRSTGREKGNNQFQRVEIPVNQFQGANKRIRDDFLEMINAEEYPFIMMTLAPRNLAECRKSKGLSDFQTTISIAGTSQRYVVPCGVDTCQHSGYVLHGNLEVKLTDFGINPPRKFFGLVKVNNEVLIDYVFRFQEDDPIFGMKQK